MSEVSFEAVEASSADWLAFAQSRPEATTFHHPAWSALLATTYAYRPLVLIRTDRRGIVAGLPILDVRSWMTGRRLMALPFTDYCPPLSVDSESLTHFAADLEGWRERVGSPSVEVRARLPNLGCLDVTSNAVRHVLPVDGEIQSLEKKLSRTWIGGIRKARREGVQIEMTRAAPSIAQFYRLHCMTRHRLGVPVQPKRYFQNLWARIVEPGLGFISVAWKSGEPIAASVFFAWNGNLIYKYGASDTRYWAARPNQLVIWAAVEWAFRNGYRSIDLGRTLLEHEGLRNFKLGLGSTEIPLEYSFIGNGRKPATDGTAMHAVSRLIKSSPQIFGRAVGEVLYRHFP